MPNRIIKESALDSEDLDRLSNGAERLFWRLVVVADDFGRFEASPQVVKARCFPRKVDTLRTGQVQTWMNELAPKLVRYYQVNGRQYGFFINWLSHQQKRANKSKFPEPPQLEQNQHDSNCNQLQSNVPVFEIEIEIENRERESKQVSDLAFEAFWKLYPKKNGKKAAFAEWRKEIGLIKELPDLVTAALKRQIEWRAAQPPGKFIPEWKDPERWIKARRWEDELPGRPIAPKPKAEPEKLVKTSDEEIARGQKLLRATVEELSGKMTNW